MTKPTKKAINRLGDKIRVEGKDLSNETLVELQHYRTSHKDALSGTFNILCSIAKKVNQNAIVTYRIKRFESIIGKLSRYPQMQFSRMWDIGGCRCILRNNQEVYKLKALIYKNLDVKKVYDYIDAPQEEGYKSLHLFASIPGDEKVIEIQLRNQVDHNWATLVEITDFLFDSKLKEYKENKDLLRFHYLLSKVNDIDISEKVELSNILKQYNYFEKLSSVFTGNYILVRKQWFNIENRYNHKYFLIETKKNEVPLIKSFSNFTEAENEYFISYQTRQNANIVLTHLPNPCYNQISIAYSNYLLTFHSFLNECFQIQASLVIDSLKQSRYIAFSKNFGYYNNLSLIHIKNLNTEILTINSHNETAQKSINKRKKIEWENDIKSQLREMQERNKKLVNGINKTPPKNEFEKIIFKSIIKRINRRYIRKVKRVLENK